ncbi:MAG: selenide, water dikinase SelD [Planctomycetota bacterium]|nr:selenide, water dikinase SelD [Planctomycetota bacterium]
MSGQDVPQLELAQVLGQLPQRTCPDLIVGTNTADDAGVYRISDELALVQTIDIFPPVVDDPFDYGDTGRPACPDAAGLDGGDVICVMNAVGFPVDKLPHATLAEILKGGAQAVADAGAYVVGGHTWTDSRVIYGMSVTGKVHPDRVFTLDSAQAGDKLLLTKPLGVGSITNAVKPGKVDAAVLEAAVNSMKKLNLAASKVMREYDVHACTDITGFGLLGHLSNMIKESKVGAEIDSKGISLLPGALDLADAGLCSPMSFKNYRFLKDMLELDSDIPKPLVDVLLDAETSGGLLISVAANDTCALLDELLSAGHNASLVGRITKKYASPAITVR